MNGVEGRTIWVDADAAPKPVKEILFRAAIRLKLPVILVANQPLLIPNSNYVEARVVGKGFDVADDRLVHPLHALAAFLEHALQAGRLVVI